jgi:ferritin-like metal-binding protein YciE
MAEAGSLHDAFIDELRDTYDAEKQLLKALPKMAKAASSPELRQAFEMHRDETQGQIQRLEEVFSSLEEKPRGKHCEGIAGIIEEGKAIMEEDFDEAAMDASLIAAGQRAEHYEMAAYGTLVAWARAMGHTEAADLLQQTLDEEKATDEKLSQLAESGINQEAAGAAHPQDEEAEEAEEAPARGGRTAAKAMAAGGGMGGGRGASAGGRGSSGGGSARGGGRGGNSRGGSSRGASRGGSQGRSAKKSSGRR